MNYYAVDRSGYISHHGILGMKWGVRRYQNADGSLTPAGRNRYDVGEKIGKMRDSVNKYMRSNKRRNSKGKYYYSKRDDVRFKDARPIKKVLRTAYAVTTLGLGKPLTRLTANHKVGAMVVSGILNGVQAGVTVGLLGPAALPAAAIKAGAQMAGAFAGVHLDDVLYKELYTKK